MTYTREYVAKSEHIDVQDIMDGLYYPFYMEDCRHNYIREVLGLDIPEQAAQGVNIVLSQYFLKFRRPLKRDDQFTVTCEARPDAAGKPVFHLLQEIHRDGMVVTEAVFTATFVPSAGGRSYLPDSLQQLLAHNEPFDFQNPFR